MRVRSFSGGFGELDVANIVSQMDQITWELKSAWARANGSSWVVLTVGIADAINARLFVVNRSIQELDVGGSAREHVFFPAAGQTQDEAWAAYRAFAGETRQSLAELGQFISNWQLSTVLPRIGADVGRELKTDFTWIAVGVGAVLALSVVGSARRAFSGYARRRRRH